MQDTEHPIETDSFAEMSEQDGTQNPELAEGTILRQRRQSRRARRLRVIRQRPVLQQERQSRRASRIQNFQQKRIQVGLTTII